MFADNIFKSIFLNENHCIWIQILLKFIMKSSINNKTELVQVVAWRRTGDKPLSEPMGPMGTKFHDAIVYGSTRPQWLPTS